MDCRLLPRLQAATPKKTIPVSAGTERRLKKLVLEAEATGFQEPGKGGWEPGGDRLGEKSVLGGLDWRQTGVYSQPPGGQKTNSGLKHQTL